MPPNQLRNDGILALRSVARDDKKPSSYFVICRKLILKTNDSGWSGYLTSIMS
jgi:hypothetical protein